MLKSIAIGAALAVMLAGPAAGQVVKREGQPSVVFTDGSAEMDAAVARARETLPVFFATMNGKTADSSDATGFMMKVALPTRDGGSEYIWVGDIVLLGGGRYDGALANVPLDLACCTREGERVEFSDDMITDWTYTHAGKFRGHFTTRLLVSELDGDEAASVKALLKPDPLPPIE